MKKILLFAFFVPLVTTAQIIRTVTGNGMWGMNGNGGPATAAELDAPLGVAADATGNYYIIDGASCLIRKVSSTGTISAFAGRAACLADPGRMVQWPHRSCSCTFRHGIYRR